MNLITNTWRQLIRRKLWPLALLLVGALVAVPLKLSKSPEPVPPAPAAVTAKAEVAEAIAKPIVELTSVKTSSQPGKRRRVLGALKDPFEPAPLSNAKKKKAKAAHASPAPTSTPAPSSNPSSGGGASAPPAGAPPVSPPTTSYPKYSIKVRFGRTDSESDLPVLTLARLDPLPSPETPVLVYEGVQDGGKYAVFSIPADVTAVGDGKCAPNPQDCATLKLRAGETEFITVSGTGDAATDAQYQLDLVKIYNKPTSVPTDPNAAAAATSSALKGYRFDAKTGTLQRVKQQSRRLTP
jgi:hypothetical protein